MNHVIKPTMDHAPASEVAIELRQQGGTRLTQLMPIDADASADYRPVARRIAAEALAECGAVLFRGFDTAQLGSFQTFAAGFGHPLASYEFGSTPRSQLGKGIYSSTEYPAHQWIDQHNEQSYTLKWPRWIWFHCEVASAEGGATPIADSREVYRRIDPEIRERFRQKQVLYVRNYGNGLDVPWEDVFGTDQRDVVESYCATHRIDCEWLADGSLRTRQVCPAQLAHPDSGEMLWFNQAHLFHVSNLTPDIREALLAVLDDDHTLLPRNTYYGDGSPIEDEVLAHIRAVYRDCMLSFAWQPGDTLMLDNLLVSHGREPFSGPRRILVAMAE